MITLKSGFQTWSHGKNGGIYLTQGNSWFISIDWFWLLLIRLNFNIWLLTYFGRALFVLYCNQAITNVSFAWKGITLQLGSVGWGHRKSTCRQYCSISKFPSFKCYRILYPMWPSPQNTVYSPIHLNCETLQNIHFCNKIISL